MVMVIVARPFASTVGGPSNGVKFPVTLGVEPLGWIRRALSLMSACGGIEFCVAIAPLKFVKMFPSTPIRPADVAPSVPTKSTEKNPLKPPGEVRALEFGTYCAIKTPEPVLGASAGSSAKRATVPLFRRTKSYWEVLPPAVILQNPAAGIEKFWQKPATD